VESDGRPGRTWRTSASRQTSTSITRRRISSNAATQLEKAVEVLKSELNRSLMTADESLVIRGLPVR
jgi:hypothetical protein